MNNDINIKKGTTNKGKTAFLFMLALLMLVVSCPFKRLLQPDNNVQTSQQSVKWNGADRGMDAFHNACSSAKKQKITLVEFEISKQKLVAPEIFAEQNFQSGFTLHYFLSGTENQYHRFFASTPSSLPLFLQYCRLLI